jgi:hypothetical protein
MKPSIRRRTTTGGEPQLVVGRKHLHDMSRHWGIRPISDHGNVNEIVGKFGGADQLRDAVNQLQSLLYATGSALACPSATDLHQEHLGSYRSIS